MRWRHGVLSPASAISRAEPAVSAATMGLSFEPAMSFAALAQRMDVAFHGLDVRERRSLDREQLMTNRHEMLGNDMKTGVRHQMVDIGHTPATEFSIGIIPRSASRK